MCLFLLLFVTSVCPTPQPQPPTCLQEDPSLDYRGCNGRLALWCMTQTCPHDHTLKKKKKKKKAEQIFLLFYSSNIACCVQDHSTQCESVYLYFRVSRNFECPVLPVHAAAAEALFGLKIGLCLKKPEAEGAVTLGT